MAKKNKLYHHGIDLQGNDLKGAVVNEAPVNDGDVVNKKALVDNLIYDTERARQMFSTLSTIGGLPAGTQVYNRPIKNILDSVFFDSPNVNLKKPEMVESNISIVSQGITLGFGTVASPIVVSRFVDYDADADVSFMFRFRKNDGGNPESLIINGTDYFERASVSFEDWLQEVSRIEITLPLKELLPDLNVRQIDIAVGYAEGIPWEDYSGVKPPQQIEAGAISYPSAVQFTNIGYPAFFKVIDFGTNLTVTFNYQTEADGYFSGTNFTSKPQGKVMVIGIPVQGGFVGYTVFGKSVNITDRAIRRDVNISSSKNTSSIPYKLYYFHSTEEIQDFTVGVGDDLAQAGLGDTGMWVGLPESLICLNPTIDNTARYTAVHYFFGSKATGVITKNEGQVADTTSNTCQVGGQTDGGQKLADLSMNRFPSLEQLYQTVQTNLDCEQQINNGNEPVYIKGDKLEGDFSGVLQSGFAIYPKAKGYGVIEIRTDKTYAFHKWPQAYNIGTYEWVPVASSGACEVILGQGTGKYVYTQIELVVDGIPQGVYKENIPSDQDYIESEYTSQCLQLTTSLGKGNDDISKGYSNINTANGNFLADKASFPTALKTDYSVSAHTGLAYRKQASDGRYVKAGRNSVYYTMVQFFDTFYKILQVNPDSTYQLHYYMSNTDAKVPTKWIGIHETSLCAVGVDGQYTGLIHYTEIREVYADNNFEIPVQGSNIKPNGQDGNTVADEGSELCKSNIDPIEYVTYQTLQARIANKTLAENKKYCITDFQTVSSYSYNDSTPIILKGTIERLIVTATGIDTLDIVAKSKEYPNDIIYYTPDNIVKNALYAGAEKGYISYRKDTINNTEYDFDVRGLKTGASPTLNVSNQGHRVIPNEIINIITDSKICLKHTIYNGSRQATGCSVYFDGEVAVSNSTIKVNGGEILRFTEDGSGIGSKINNSTLEISQLFVRTGVASGNNSSNPPSKHYRGDGDFNTFPLNLSNCSIKVDIMSIYTQSNSEKPTFFNARNWSAVIGQLVFGVSHIDSLPHFGVSPNMSIQFFNENDISYEYPLSDIYPTFFAYNNPNCRTLASYFKTVLINGVYTTSPTYEQV